MRAPEYGSNSPLPPLYQRGGDDRQLIRGRGIKYGAAMDSRLRGNDRGRVHVLDHSWLLQNSFSDLKVSEQDCERVASGMDAALASTPKRESTTRLFMFLQPA